MNVRHLRGPGGQGTPHVKPLDESRRDRPYYDWFRCSDCGYKWSHMSKEIHPYGPRSEDKCPRCSRRTVTKIGTYEEDQ